MRNPQRLYAVALDAVVHAEWQFVAVRVGGQSIELEWTAVADGWPAELVRQPVHRLGWAPFQLERTAGIDRRCTGFFIEE